VPKPEDLTPADTSSHVVPKLAEAIRKFHPNVKEISMPYAPEESDVRLLLEALVGYDLIIIGTLNAFNQTGQAEVVREVHRRGKAYIVLATRLPYDLVAFPGAPTYLCSYGLLEPSMQAAAKCLFGQMEIRGHLPAGIPGLHPAGYSMNR
jgi:beta-N-acetylhexosaminidase